MVNTFLNYLFTVLSVLPNFKDVFPVTLCITQACCLYYSFYGMFSYKPVSYTHLDVYKRQVYTPCHICTILFGIIICHYGFVIKYFVYVENYTKVIPNLGLYQI